MEDKIHMTVSIDAEEALDKSIIWSDKTPRKLGLDGNFLSLIKDVSWKLSAHITLSGERKACVLRGARRRQLRTDGHLAPRGRLQAAQPQPQTPRLGTGKGVKLRPCGDATISCKENTKDFRRNLPEIINTLNNAAQYKSHKKSIEFLYTSNEQLGKEIRKMIPFTGASKE